MSASQLIGLCVLLVLGYVACSKAGSPLESINIEDVLKSARFVDNFAKCLLDKGKCTPEGKEAKYHLIPEYLQNDCSKCSKKQKETSDKMMAHLKEHRPDLHKLIIEKYDPDGKYRAKYEAGVIPKK